jgi:hypothetical protein
MTIRGVGISLPYPCPGDGVRDLAVDLEVAKSAGPDFVEVFPDQLGVILGGDLVASRLRFVRESLFEANLAYTVHAPLEINLMDLTTHDLQRKVLNASIEFASGIVASVLVCHADHRIGSRDARYSLNDQLAAERSALREAGDLAGELSVNRRRELLPRAAHRPRRGLRLLRLALGASRADLRSRPPRGRHLPRRGARGPSSGLLRLRLLRGVRRRGAPRPPPAPPRQPDEDQPYRRAGGLRAPRLRAGRPAPATRNGDHPARRSLPASRFP